MSIAMGVTIIIIINAAAAGAGGVGSAKFYVSDVQHVTGAVLA